MITTKLKHFINFISDSEYRELIRIKNSPRYTPLFTDLLGSSLKIVDGLSFYYSYIEIFKKNIYEFIPKNNQPVIIDAGSNIGLSIIFFKLNYPASKIYAFEANPEVFETLKLNIDSFNLDDINLFNKAVWNSETTLNFLATKDDAGRISRAHDELERSNVMVQTIRLAPYLNIPIDLLKLDIEGAETQVISDCSDHLKNINNIFIEYHSFSSEEQTLDELLLVLKEAGFRIQIQPQFCSPQPFISRLSQCGMDLQLNIFGYRE